MGGAGAHSARVLAPLPAAPHPQVVRDPLPTHAAPCCRARLRGARYVTIKRRPVLPRPDPAWMNPLILHPPGPQPPNLPIPPPLPLPPRRQVLVGEGLAERADLLGERLRARLRAIPSARVAAVRGRGLLVAVDIAPSRGATAWDVCVRLRDAGLLTKPTGRDNNTIRLAPPLVLSEEQLDEAAGVIERVVLSFDQ